MLIFSVHGAQLFSPCLPAAELGAIKAAIPPLPTDQPGLRLHGVPELRPFLAASGSIGKVAASVLGINCRPVRTILFDKKGTKNWSLGWHQDRTIAIKERRAVSGFGPWTVKDGMVHVEPPFDLLATMVTLRVHFDPVTESNAPLLIAPGSHKLGRISDRNIAEAVKQCGVFACHADAGDVWLYATPILHASKAASNPSHRRVLQVDYSILDLPGGLEWLGV
ncbi:MAG TPA: phytanoyl-CoA dioxygenase family protein [Rhizomicrobium sp.]|jgi:ectoine hydroxylase-related dioxygenase (phytanoyl-CoA dioxygenase family)